MTNSSEFEDFFFKRLSQLRTLKGISAREMSLSIGQSEGYINGIENKNNFPAMSTFFYICEYLKITPKEFFDDNVTYPDKLKELFEYAQLLDEKKLTDIVSIVKGLVK